ncbi:Tubulin-specific chaperone E [Sphaceloma murrayae]|uniref:Tubulin-specific chaperone E n=1 Tax=Sphaceloma murrayae TaxID=2082308 RepID=A0A2K1QMT2_9PEZI|nr:Tubulin-specific chaperone E [Sphaceloma murrayae]
MASYLGKRLSVKGDLCTVRYIGKVESKSDDFLGVEWDDPTRGKHDGSFGGRRYFHCRNTSSACASFIKASSRGDITRSVHEAVRLKYVSGETLFADVRFSNKVVDETGYEKIAVRQSQLDDLKVVILDHQRISATENPADSSLSTLTPNIQQLDLSHNLLEDASDVARIADGCRHLNTLSLAGNRFRGCESACTMATVTTLSLQDMLLLPEE